MGDLGQRFQIDINLFYTQNTKPVLIETISLAKLFIVT